MKEKSHSYGFWRSNTVKNDFKSSSSSSNCRVAAPRSCPCRNNWYNWLSITFLRAAMSLRMSQCFGSIKKKETTYLSLVSRDCMGSAASAGIVLMAVKSRRSWERSEARTVYRFRQGTLSVHCVAIPTSLSVMSFRASSLRSLLPRAQLRTPHPPLVRRYVQNQQQPKSSNFNPWSNHFSGTVRTRAFLQAIVYSIVILGSVSVVAPQLLVS